MHVCMHIHIWSMHAHVPSVQLYVQVSIYAHLLYTCLTEITEREKERERGGGGGRGGGGEREERGRVKRRTYADERTHEPLCCAVVYACVGPGDTGKKVQESVSSVQYARILRHIHSFTHSRLTTAAHTTVTDSSSSMPHPPPPPPPPLTCACRAAAYPRGTL